MPLQSLDIQDQTSDLPGLKQATHLLELFFKSTGCVHNPLNGS